MSAIPGKNNLHCFEAVVLGLVNGAQILLVNRSAAVI